MISLLQIYEGRVFILLDTLEKLVDYMRKLGVDFCDARFEQRENLQILTTNGNIRAISRNVRSGVSIRAFLNGHWGYASSTELSWESLKSAAEKAVKIVKSTKGTEKIELNPVVVEKKYKPPIKINPQEISLEEKINLLLELDKAQRKADQRVVNSNTRYSDSCINFTVVNSEGSKIEWSEIRIGVVAMPVAFEAGKMQSSYFVKSGTRGYELVKEIDPNVEGESVAKEAVELLSAEKPPGGYLTVIIDPDVAGLLAHEVMGHASEADEIVKKRSFLTGVVGKKVGSELVTMVDDGTVPGAYGTIPFDSEGTPSSKTIIIENGVYKGYMHNLETAAIMNVKLTGNGRAQDYNRRVWVRMTNTFFEKGDWDLEEMISETKKGLLALKALSGMEDPVGGGFEARVLKGYIIENGEKKNLVRSFTLTGKALDILKTVDAVSKDFILHGGSCGKGEEDFVPVSTGGPYMRAKILVGGG